jgi:hypothetical protein
MGCRVESGGFSLGSDTHERPSVIVGHVGCRGGPRSGQAMPRNVARFPDRSRRILLGRVPSSLARLWWFLRRAF